MTVGCEQVERVFVLIERVHFAADRLPLRYLSILVDVPINQANFSARVRS